MTFTYFSYSSDFDINFYGIVNFSAEVIAVSVKPPKMSLVYSSSTVMPAKCDSDGMFCLQSYQGFIINRSLVY